jgi:uracil-DNA glycosylase
MAQGARRQMLTIRKESGHAAFGRSRQVLSPPFGLCLEPPGLMPGKTRLSNPRLPAPYNRFMPSADTAKFPTLDALNSAIIGCNLCPRLRSYCAEVARVRRRAYLDWEYWGRPVPSFGDPHARVLALGLAPGAHGSNRTGRPFTGDGSGDFLYPVLHEAGFASQSTATSRNDGMKLNGLLITSVARCAPPANKPTPEELRRCAPWLESEIQLLSKLRVVVCLGRIAFDGLLAHQIRAGKLTSRAGFVFTHGAEYTLPGGLKTIASYHPSLQNTNTGKLTHAMLLNVFRRARKLAGMG